jgi:phosphoglycerate dehydrogenase-like enzyme
MPKHRLYIENGRARPEIYQVTPARWAAASGRHKQEAAQIDAVFAFDDERNDAALAAAEIAIGSRIDPDRLKAHGRKLRWIHSTSAGVENMAPFDWLPEGATLTNSRGIHAPKSGEFGLLALLMLNDNMPAHAENQRAHRWGRVFATPIAGKTAVVLGMGNMGRAAAEKAKLLGVRIIGVQRKPKPDPVADKVVGPDQLRAVLPEADFLLIATPLTAETRGMVGAAELALMKPTAGIVNIGRAAVMDYDALAAALRAGKFSGAILDVFSPEPLPADSPLWDVPRLVVVPHVSSDDVTRYIDLALDAFFRNFPSYAAGEPLPSRVDTRLGY